MIRLRPLSVRFKGILTVSVLRALTMAMLSPIFALYIKQFVNSDFTVSLVYTCSFLFSLIATIYGSVIVEYLQKRKTMIVSLILFICVILAFSFSQTSITTIILFILYTFLFTLLFFGINLYIDNLSNTKNLATHFGENGTLTNISWIIGPILGGFIAETLSYIDVFLIASLIAFIALLIFIFSEPPERKHKLHHHIYIFRNIKSFFSERFLRSTYIQGLGFTIFYGASALAPLLFRELGASVGQIGLFLGLSAIPWILLELPIGKIADKKQREHSLFILTYAILAPSLVLFGISRQPITAFLFLTCTSIATALSESTTLSYFYRKVPQSNLGYISVFLTFPSMGLFLGTLFATLTLSVTSLGTAYAILGFLLLPFLWNAIRLRKLTSYGR